MAGIDDSFDQVKKFLKMNALKNIIEAGEDEEDDVKTGTYRITKTEPRVEKMSSVAGGPAFGQTTNIEDAEENAEIEVQMGTTGTGRKRIFSKELRCMMYGFGDDQNPYTESVDLLEDLVIDFITQMTHKAMEIGRTGRVQVEDIIFLVRKDARKYARVKDLLTMNEELKKARKAFDEVKFAVASD